MFESAKAIREAKKAQIREKTIRKERERILKAFEQHGVTLSPEVVEAVFKNPPNNPS